MSEDTIVMELGMSVTLPCGHKLAFRSVTRGEPLPDQPSFVHVLKLHEQRIAYYVHHRRHHHRCELVSADNPSGMPSGGTDPKFNPDA